jgi:hypothetical protein
VNRRSFGTGSVFLDLLVFSGILLEELVGGLSQGAPVARNFGLGGQETVRNPGAREPDRLFLVGWEVSQFWAELQGRVSEQHQPNNITG